ncbi:hypothetical protein DRE_04612 [Drechslerella stenobrocha 248]|uniref:FHA domain-containing protein n=1 Tax=Drechslerella stenobrocha 248 TaxID=1043628 RepID=W7HSK9_9PEZI|nr:hypothetical protein DRE_04612 [Drechslerella stenobrocha 248]
MWILDTDTPLLGGRRIWLRPGAESILGRTNYTGLAPKVISRRHVIMAVDAVPEGQGLSVRHHSQLTLRDESKKGSTVDGEFINNAAVMLAADTEHTLQLATAPEMFRIKYEPQVFSVHLTGKKKANLKTGLKDYLAKLEQLDIKCVAEFLPGKTTAVVVPKRNLPVSLRALIAGPLQADLAANWPNPLAYLPPPGAEPNPKGPEYFTPNLARRTMFEKWVVVCCSQQHMDVFTGVVTDAGGKMELFELVENRTKPAELVVHLERMGPRCIILAPNTDDDWHATFRSQVEARAGVRFAVQNEFLDAVLLADPTLLRRPYESADVPVHESLELPSAPPSVVDEAMKESQPVTRQLRIRGRGVGVEVEVAHLEAVTEPAPAPAPPPAESSLRRMQTTQSRTSRYVSQIKIDDSDDENFVPLPAPSASSATIGKSTVSSLKTTFRGASQSQAGLATRATQLSSVPEVGTQSQGVKRRSVPSSSEDEDAAMDKILPGQAAMKKRRIEEAAKDAQPARPTKTLPSSRRKPTASPPPPPVKREPYANADADMDIKPLLKGKQKAVDSVVIKTAQEIRRKEEAVAALEDAAYEMSPEEIATVAKMRNLAVVETFPVIARADRPFARSQAYGDEGARWDERWNGRKNFKKFKRRARDGALEGPMRRMGGHIMVPLVEHRPKDYGIGESYWLESAGSSGKRRTNVGGANNANTNNTNQSSVQTHVSETQMLLAPVNRGSRRQADVQEEEASSGGSDDGFVIGDEDGEEEEEEEETNIDERESVAVRRTQDTQASSMKGNTRFSVTSAMPAPTRIGRAKRTTSNRNSVSEEPVKKKAKTAVPLFTNDSEDDSEDELRFRFK